MISQKSVQEIFDTAKVEDVVGDYVELKRRGVNLIGVCPFHNEKTPSFTVSPAKNIYKCFGCGQGGGPLQFLMEHDTLTYPEALRNLAARYNIEIEEDQTNEKSQEERQILDSFNIINDFAQDFFTNNLFNTPEGKSVGLSYFKERGYNQATIEKFGLGIAFFDADSLTKAAVAKSYNVELLQQLGLTTKSNKDFFRNRVMFPIHHPNGKVIAFAGRILKPNKKAPKYLNSPETEFYHKSNVLYAAHLAKGPMRKKDECILVEGYTDVISLHQAGIENVVASSGTSLTVGQIKLIRRYTPNIKILYDGDSAGIKAALRGLDLVLKEDLNVKVVLLPEGHDPDSYLKAVGSTAFETYLDSQAKDFILFKTDLLLKETEGDPIKKAGLVKDIVSSISLIPDPIKRSVYIQECANLMDIPEQILINAANKEVSGILTKKKQDKEREERKAERNAERNSEGNPEGLPPEFQNAIEDDSGPRVERKASIMETKELSLVRTLINFGDKIYDEEENITVAEFLLGNIEDHIDKIQNQICKSIIEEYHSLLVDEKKVTLSHFINHRNKEIAKFAVDISSSKDEMSENWFEKHGVELQSQPPPELNHFKDSTQSLLYYELERTNQLIHKNQLLLREAKDAAQLKNIMGMANQLIKQREELKKKLGME